MTASPTSRSASVAAPALPRLGLRRLWRVATGAESLVHGDLAEADALVVFAFGEGPGRRSAVTNRQLAALTDRWPDVPVLAQTEVAVAIARRGRTVVDIEADLRERHGLAPDTYVDTAMMAEAAVSIVRAAGWLRVGVLTHPLHLGRSAALVASAGLDPLVPDLSDARIDFDSKSTQWWTRSRNAWLVREAAVLAHHKLLRRI